MKPLIITGGTGGLGTSVVERLARDYQCVLLTRELASTRDYAYLYGRNRIRLTLKR